MGKIMNRNNSIFIIYKTQLNHIQKNSLIHFAKRSDKFKINDETIISTYAN